MNKDNSIKVLRRFIEGENIDRITLKQHLLILLEEFIKPKKEYVDNTPLTKFKEIMYSFQTLSPKRELPEKLQWVPRENIKDTVLRIVNQISDIIDYMKELQ